MADIPTQDPNWFNYFMAGIGALFTIGGAAVAQMHQRSEHRHDGDMRHRGRYADRIDV